jgi:hypothetical protein
MADADSHQEYPPAVQGGQNNMNRNRPPDAHWPCLALATGACAARTFAM